MRHDGHIARMRWADASLQDVQVVLVALWRELFAVLAEPWGCAIAVESGAFTVAAGGGIFQ